MTSEGRTPSCETYLWSFGYPIPCKRVDEHPDEPGAHHYDTTPPLPGHPLYDAGRVPSCKAGCAEVENQTCDDCSGYDPAAVEGRGPSHDRMDFHLGVATCRCGWTGPQADAQAHLLANPPASVAGRVPSCDCCQECRWKYGDMLGQARLEVRQRLGVMRLALERIANEDYRGNEPESRRIAREALDRG